jgi:hypothetical protein
MPRHESDVHRHLLDDLTLTTPIIIFLDKALFIPMSEGNAVELETKFVDTRSDNLWQLHQTFCD